MGINFRCPALAAALFVTSGAHAVLINPDFETGDFSGWTLFTTEHGVSESTVTAFDIAQDGDISLAARFMTGRSIFDPAVGPQGGGISQQFYARDGQLTIALNAAVSVAIDHPNAVSGNGGDVLILVDGTPIIFHEFGVIPNNSVATVLLTGDLFVSEEHHILTILFQRSFLLAESTSQYVDNIALGGSAVVPIPAAALLFTSACAVLGIARRSRFIAGGQ